MSAAIAGSVSLLPASSAPADTSGSVGTDPGAVLGLNVVPEGGAAAAAPARAQSFLQLLNAAAALPDLAPRTDANGVALAQDAAAANGAAENAAFTADAAAAMLALLMPGGGAGAVTAQAGPVTTIRAGVRNVLRQDEKSVADQAALTNPLLAMLAGLAQAGSAASPAAAAAAAPATNDAASAATLGAGGQGRRAVDGASSPIAGQTSPPDAALSGTGTDASSTANAVVLRLPAEPTERLSRVRTGAADASNALRREPGSRDTQLGTDGAGNIDNDFLATLRLVLPAQAPTGGSPVAGGRSDPGLASADATIESADSTAPAGSSAYSSGAALAQAGGAIVPTAHQVVRTISTPVQHPNWAQAVAAEVTVFAEHGVQSATLRLTPDHLGPVEVHLALSDGQVNVNFTAANADTRAALEQSLPQLRDMLAGAGLSLGEAQVQQQMRQGSQNSFNGAARAADTEVRDTLTPVALRLGLVDEYA